MIFAVVKQLLKAVAKEAQKKSEASTGFEPMTSTIPMRYHQLSYEASLEADHEQVESLTDTKK